MRLLFLLVVVGCSSSHSPLDDGGSSRSDAGSLFADVPVLDPSMPHLENVRVTVRGTTAVVEFDPFDGARDYRIYPATGSERDVIYRCAGDRPQSTREHEHGYELSLSAGPEYHGYVRSADEATLGYVFATPGPGRLPIYRVSDPNARSGYLNSEWMVPPSVEFVAADYVASVEARDALIARGWRDDGIAFYAPEDADRVVYRREFALVDWRGRTSFFYTDGPEAIARAADPTPSTDFGERFRVASAPRPGAIALHRVFYAMGDAHDVLAAGEARFERAMRQGNLPLTSLAWPGLTGPTTLVIEALDQGCPFPGGHIALERAAPDELDPVPSISLDEARVASSGAVYFNGQHDPTNRPIAIARNTVDIAPEAVAMRWYEDFHPSFEPFALESSEPDNGVYFYGNSRVGVELRGCSGQRALGAQLDGLLVACSSDNMSTSVIPRGIDVQLNEGSYVHAMMSVAIPATLRRYPQILLTTTPVVAPSEELDGYEALVRSRLGPRPDIGERGMYSTIVIQPYRANEQLQVQYCDHRMWGGANHCPQANLYGYHAGDFASEWSSPWLPVPALSEVNGFDRPVQIDVYASTRRVYVLVDERPAGCAVLPDAGMPQGPITVLFGSTLYHSVIDDEVIGSDAPHGYLARYSLARDERRFDALGVDVGVAPPAWDESVLPCGTRWY